MILEQFWLTDAQFSKSFRRSLRIFRPRSYAGIWVMTA